MNRKERYYVNEEYLDDDLPNHVIEDEDDDLPNHVIEDEDDEQEGGWKGRGSWKNKFTQEDYFGYPARELRAGVARTT